jgi:Ca-activated chloride channel family protein
MAPVHWQRPWALAALGVLPVLAGAWALACLRIRRAVPDSSLAALATRVNLARGVARLTALALVIGGLAGPVLPSVPSRSRAVPLVFVLDVSASMEAADVRPHRLARAQAAVRAISFLVPEALVALVTAADDALVLCPPTGDRSAFVSLLEQAPRIGPAWRGSRLGAALEAVGRLTRSHGGGVAIIVSDGEFHDEAPDDQLRRLAHSGVLVHTLAVGSATGATVPPSPTRGAVISRARIDTMAGWARAGGGRAWRITPDEDDLPLAPDDVIPPAIAVRTAVAAGSAPELAPFLYAAAVLLLVADRLLPG